MYENRSHLRTNEIKVRFDEDTIRAVRALAVLARKQPVAFVRDLALKEIRRQARRSIPQRYRDWKSLMRSGDSPELADRMFTEALHFTSAEYADLQTLADRNGVSVEELIVRTTREVLLARFGGEQRREGNVLPFERP